MIFVFFPRKMNTRRTPTLRVEENEVKEEIPPQNLRKLSKFLKVRKVIMSLLWVEVMMSRNRVIEILERICLL